MGIVSPPPYESTPAHPEQRSPPEPIAAAPSTKAGKRAKASLRDRLQSESSSFAFESLLDDSAAFHQPRVSINSKDCAEMVWIPPCEFDLSGRQNDILDSSSQCHFLAGFWMYKNPVTVAQYRRFYADIGRTLRNAPQFGWDEEHPMVNVNWHFADAYARWAGADLPSEREWERAACGIDRRRFPWGDEWDPSKCHNSVEGGQSGPTRVNCHLSGASHDGVQDMAGNVWEWTADWYELPQVASDRAEQALESRPSQYRVLRGGSWGNGTIADFFTSTRVPCDPDVRGETIGFRCIIRSNSV
jgi:formylglycine-generating enzyme required for sulfatase activity